MSPPNRNYGDAIAVQDLKEFIYEILFDVPPTKFLAPPLLSPPNIRVQETPWLLCTYMYVYVRCSVMYTLTILNERNNFYVSIDNTVFGNASKLIHLNNNSIRHNSTRQNSSRHNTSSTTTELIYSVLLTISTEI